MGSNQKADLCEDRLAATVRNKLAEKESVIGKYLLPSYHYPEPRGARAEEEAKRRRSRNETWLKDYPTGTFYNLQDWWTYSYGYFPLVGKGYHRGQCMWIDKGVTIRDGGIKATSCPMDTIDEWRSQGNIESEYQATIYNPKKQPTKAVKEKSIDKKKTHLPDVPIPRVRFTAVRCSPPQHYDTTPGPGSYLPERWPFH